MQVEQDKMSPVGGIESDPGRRDREFTPPGGIVPDDDQRIPRPRSICRRHTVGNEVDTVRRDGLGLLGQQRGLSENGFADDQPADLQFRPALVSRVIAGIIRIRRGCGSGHQFRSMNIPIAGDEIERIAGPRIKPLQKQPGFGGLDTALLHFIVSRNGFAVLPEDVLIRSRLFERHEKPEGSSGRNPVGSYRSPGIKVDFGIGKRYANLRDADVSARGGLRHDHHIGVRIGNRGRAGPNRSRDGEGTLFEHGRPSERRLHDSVAHTFAPHRKDFSLPVVEKLKSVGVRERQQEIGNDGQRNFASVSPESHRQRPGRLVVNDLFEKRVEGLLGGGRQDLSALGVQDMHRTVAVIHHPIPLRVHTEHGSYGILPGRTEFAAVIGQVDRALTVAVVNHPEPVVVDGNQRNIPHTGLSDRERQFGPVRKDDRIDVVLKRHAVDRSSAGKRADGLDTLVQALHPGFESFNPSVEIRKIIFKVFQIGTRRSSEHPKRQST